MKPLLRSAVLIAALLAFTVTPVAGETSSCSTAEDATWGGIKAAYRGASCADAERVATEGHRPSSLFGVRYPLRDSPQNALENIRQSYEAMDAEAYLDCLAEDFIFYPNPRDVASNPSMPPEWYKMHERDMHYNMFGDGGNVERVVLSFDQVGDWVEIPSPGAESCWEYRGNYDLMMELVGGLTYMAREGMVLLFRVDLDQVGPGGEELWEVLHWWDVDRLQVSPAEDSTWSEIKALFM